MATAAQITANTANAQLSTGPRTEVGMARSSANSTSHGFYSKNAVLLTAADQQAFADLKSAYTIELRPGGPLERTLFDQLVLAAWNLQRADRLEAGLAAGGIDPLLCETQAAVLSRIATFRMRAERTFHKSLKELRVVQAEHAAVDSIARNEPKSAAPIPIRAALPARKTGRNGPCPCKSGRKFKHCCLGGATAKRSASSVWENDKSA